MSLLRRSVRLSAVVLLLTTHQLPAPIQEVPENPTPAPEQSAKAKPKRKTKPKVTTENSESAKKQEISSAKSQPTPPRNLIDGTWVGTLNDIRFTAVISGYGTVVRETSDAGTFTWNATYDGRTMRWTWERFLISGTATATPNPDGRTAVVTSYSEGSFLGVGAHNSSSIFQKISP